MGCLPQKNMKKVVEDVLVNKLSLRKAAERNCVKYQTLARYVKKSQEIPNGTEPASSSSESDVNSFVSDSSDAESFSEFEMDLKDQESPEVDSFVSIEFHDKKSIFYVAKILYKKMMSSK